MSEIRHSAGEEAAQWFAKLRRGMMTLDERRSLETWRRIPANAAALSELGRVWEKLEAARTAFAAGTATASPKRYTNIARSVLLALLCVASIGFGVISYSGNNAFWTELDWIDR